jgi:DNA-binding beta-propeller fold protein YncE
MKRIVLTVVLIVAVSFASYARKFVAEGKTYSALGNYRIEIDNKSMMINGKQHIPFVISYANSNLEVRVAVDMDKTGKKYYVISDNLSVQYVANRQYFGVEKLAPELEKDGFKTSDAALNRVEYFHQKVITSGVGWRRDNTKLIAAFFPMLLNNVENLIAAR